MAPQDDHGKKLQESNLLSSYEEEQIALLRYLDLKPIVPLMLPVSSFIQF